MKKILLIAIVALGLTQSAHAQAWRNTPYVENPSRYMPAYTGYEAPYYVPSAAYNRTMPMPYNRAGYCNGCGNRGTTVVVVQPPPVYNDPYYASGAQVWSTSPIPMPATRGYYDPYGGYVDPYYSGQQVLPAGRRAAIIGLQAAQMVGSEFINLAIDNVLYGR